MKHKRGLAAALVLPILATLPHQARASGFALLEQDASGLGTAYAGTAAVANDASTVFFNPAGMSYLPGTQMSMGMNIIRPSARFQNGNTQAAGSNVPSAATLLAPQIVRPLGNSGNDAGSAAYVPNMYIVSQLSNRIHVGLGVNAPFGQATNYAPDWAGRFQGIKSSIRTVNINPSVSFKLNDMFSIGAGYNYQRIDAEFTSAVSYSGAAYNTAIANPLLLGLPLLAGGAVALNIPGSQAEGTVRLKGGDTSSGWNAGVMMQATPSTRVGLSYRSAVKYKVGGTVIFNNVPAAAASVAYNGNITGDVKLPDIATLSVLQQLGERWQVMADVAWTRWSTIQALTFYRQDGTLLQSTPENFRNTWRFAIGTTYKVNDKLSLRTGVAYDQTPVNQTNLTPRLPDNNRTWVALGAQYKVSKDATVDIGYAHLFIKDVTINQNAGDTTVNGNINGTYKLKADILGMQLAYKF